MIVEVLPGLPAERAGMKPGDIVTSFNKESHRALGRLTLARLNRDHSRQNTAPYLASGKE